MNYNYNFIYFKTSVPGSHRGSSRTLVGWSAQSRSRYKTVGARSSTSWIRIRSVVDPYHFDPDPWIRIGEKRIRIRLWIGIRPIWSCIFWTPESGSAVLWSRIILIRICWSGSGKSGSGSDSGYGSNSGSASDLKLKNIFFVNQKYGTLNYDFVIKAYLYIHILPNPKSC